MASILVVDDRPSNRQFLLTLLGYSGHSLLEADNGTEALRLARERRPDLIITDILMPQMDGLELCNRLRSEQPLAHIPVIFYTATYSETQAQKLASGCNVRAVLPKPSEPDRILAAVAAALTSGDTAPAIPSPAAGVPGADFLKSVDSTVETYLQDLQGVRVVFDGIVKMASPGTIDAPQIGDLSRRFSENVSRLQRITSRLSALIEVGLAMNSERDPDRLARVFFAAACEIIDSRIAAAGLRRRRNGRVHRILTRGIDVRVLEAEASTPTLFDALLGRRDTIRSGGDGVVLPREHPPVGNILALSVASSEQILGWIYFADRSGATEFSEEDEQLARIMATELAVRYEHALLFAELQREVAERRTAQVVLRESESRFRQLAENVHEVFWLTDTSKQEMLYVSPAYEEIWGRKIADLHAEPPAWIQAIHPLDRERVRAAARSRQVQGTYDEEYRIVRPDGSMRWIRDRAFPVRSETGEVIRVAGVAEDITERKQQALKIERLTRMYAVLSGINSMIVRIQEPSELFRECCRVIVDDGHVAAARIYVTGAPQDELRPAASAGSSDALPPGPVALSARPRIETPDDALFLAVKERRPIVVRRSGSSDAAPRSLAALPLLVSEEPAGVLALLSNETGLFDEEEMRLLKELAGDISFALEHIRRAETLKYLALYDSLTGLANRTLLLERLAQRIHLATRGGDGLAVAIADVDRLRSINASLGRQAGDQLIKQLADRLRARLPADALARVGSDQFAMMLTSAGSEAEVALQLESLWHAIFTEPFNLGGSDLTVAGKSGAALFPEDGVDPETLLRNAEAALRQAKRTGDRHVFHRHAMTETSAESLSLEHSLRRALSQKEFILHYQPIFDLESRRIVGAEALLRWMSPEKGLVMPGQFIPLLEETGMILEVGAWALAQAVRDQSLWAASGSTVPRVAVNVSSIQLRRPDFLQTVLAALSSAPSMPALDLEITESVTMHNLAGIAETLTALRELGVRVEVDDFGTGYSSLAYLARLPVHALKIDRTFIAAMLSDPPAMTLVSTIISLAHSLRMGVIAEGVETDEQANILRLLRCDQVQGYLFGRPVPSEQLQVLLSRGGTSPA